MLNCKQYLSSVEANPDDPDMIETAMKNCPASEVKNAVIKGLVYEETEFMEEISRISYDVEIQNLFKESMNYRDTIIRSLNEGLELESYISFLKVSKKIK